ANSEHPAVEFRSGLELTEGFERLFCGHLGKIVRIGRITGQGMGEPPQAGPYCGQLGIERQGRHCTSCGMKRRPFDVSSPRHKKWSQLCPNLPSSVHFC